MPTESAAVSSQQLYLPGIEAKPREGIYKDLIAGARARNSEHSKIWDLFAFQEQFTVHLARLTEGVLRTPASISPGLRELIAAFTSYQNECRFCTEAHRAAASELLGSEELVSRVLSDLESSPLEAREKALLRFATKITKNLPAVTGRDVEEVHGSGWDDEAIYYAITTCALFNFYNRWISATDVPEMSPEAHRLQGQLLAQRGYIREEKK
jgi:uncharacterized peroxidase-related enzyme